MRKTKLIIINKSDLPLKVSCKNCNLTSGDKFEVKRRFRVKLEPGRYNLMFYYDCANLKLETNAKDILEVGDIPCPNDQKFNGKMIILNYSRGPIKVICEDKFSVLEYIENQ